MFLRFLIPDGRIPLINMQKIEMIHEIRESMTFQTVDGPMIGPACQLWFDDDRYITVNATLDQIEGLLG